MTRLSRTSRTAATVAACIALAVLFTSPVPAAAQDGDSVAVDIMSKYRVAPNITYLTADGYESKLDVMTPRGESPAPTLIYIHGGGWVGGTKEASVLRALPYLEMGWAVVNVEYRMARNALAPGAVEDCRCALRWVHRNAEEYGLDTSRIVTTGASAGGHLSLTTGMLPASAGLDRLCPDTDASKPGWAKASEPEMPVGRDRQLVRHHRRGRSAPRREREDLRRRLDGLEAGPHGARKARLADDLRPPPACRRS